MHFYFAGGKCWISFIRAIKHVLLRKYPAYLLFQVDIKFFDALEAIDINDYIMSNEWMILEHPAKKNIKKYPCCVEPYPDLTFSLKIKRLSSYSGYVFITPVVAVSLLIPFMFLLPASSRQKFTLGKWKLPNTFEY